MKEKLFYFPFYPSDWLADTSILNLEEKGAYITLIATMYLQKDCSLFKRHIPNILGVTDERKFNKLMQNIIPLLIDDGEKYTQKRIKEIKNKIEGIIEKKRQAGIASGVAKRRKLNIVTTKNYTKKIDKFSDVSAIDKARNTLNNN